MLPRTVVGIKKYLGSGLVKGIGQTFADRIVEKFGEQTLEIIDHFSARLREVDHSSHRATETADLVPVISGLFITGGERRLLDTQLGRERRVIGRPQRWLRPAQGNVDRLGLQRDEAESPEEHEVNAPVERHARVSQKLVMAPG